jgi:hypothetical protein
MSSCHPGAYRRVMSVQPKLEARFLCSQTLRRYHLRSELCRTNTPEPYTTADERTLLTGFLDRHRETVGRALRRVAAPASGALLQPHPARPRAAGAGRWWLQTVIVGENPARAARLCVPSNWGDNRLSCCCLGPKALPLSN